MSHFFSLTDDSESYNSLSETPPCVSTQVMYCKLNALPNALHTGPLPFLQWPPSMSATSTPSARSCQPCLMAWSWRQWLPCSTSSSAVWTWRVPRHRQRSATRTHHSAATCSKPARCWAKSECLSVFIHTLKTCDETWTGMGVTCIWNLLDRCVTSCVCYLNFSLIIWVS